MSSLNFYAIENQNGKQKHKNDLLIFCVEKKGLDNISQFRIVQTEA